KQFEEWFKTTLSYAIFEDSNVWKVDLYAFNEPTNSYLHSGVQAAFESYQHQQAKVEEMQKEFAEDERFLKEQIKDKDLKISNLEYLQGMDKELIQTLQGRSKALQDKVNDLQKQYDQHDKWLLERNRDCNELYNINAKHVAEKVELQKRVDKALELMQKPVIVGEPAKYVCARFKEIEQALKGEGQ
ncbi:hypothetical protein PGK32_14445, partial [Acinetobacter baumannii]|nr:hypothetical protein [Acinetobacter baumannii]